MSIRVPRGILFAGPPGCGKTLLARALSAELGNHCLEVRGPEILAGVYGESEKRIRELFAEARAKSPSLILIDEIDAVAPSRQNTRGDLERRIVSTLLAEMDGLHSAGDVIVVATTNDPDVLDPALRRPRSRDRQQFCTPEMFLRKAVGVVVANRKQPQGLVRCNQRNREP